MGVFNVDKYYPVQGTNKFQTVSFPMTKAFKVDFGGGSTSAAASVLTFPKGAMILGFQARITEAYVSTGSGTFQLGFSGTALLTSAITSSVAVVGAVVGPGESTAGTGPLILAADDTFDVIWGTSGTADSGKADVFVTYVPIPSNALSSDEFPSYDVTALSS